MAALKIADNEIQTSLSVREVGIIFRDHISQRPAGAVGAIWSRKLAWSFATPPADTDPFSAINPQEAPTFQVEARFGLRRKPFGPGRDLAAALNEGAISLKVWDRGDHREVQIRCENGQGPKAHVGLVLAAIKSADARAQVRETVSQVEIK
jgi:hypothetical protein